MIGWVRFNSSRHTGLAVLLLTAVLLPIAILLFVQYRSFSDMESKTRAAVQENLRQTLQCFSRRVGENAEAFTTDILSSIDSVDVEQERLDRIADRLTAIRQSHPEVGLVFVVIHCLRRERNFALFASPDGLSRVDHENFRQAPEVKTVLDIYQNARLLREPGAS